MFGKAFCSFLARVVFPEQVAPPTAMRIAFFCMVSEEVFVGVESNELYKRFDPNDQNGDQKGALIRRNLT